MEIMRTAIMILNGKTQHCENVSYCLTNIYISRDPETDSEVHLED